MMKRKQDDEIYISCPKCSFDNYVDPDCEIPPSEQHCDECGHPLRESVN